MDIKKKKVFKMVIALLLLILGTLNWNVNLKYCA